MNPVSGVLPVDKPIGPTSHDVVAAARRALGVRRIGHTGTLDPFASGLLLLCIGQATRLAEYLSGLPKRYVATLRLGIATSTDDTEGAVIALSQGWRSLSIPEIEEAVQRQRGTRMQVPPRYSAKKVGGERLYAIARAGGDVEPEPVQVTVYSIGTTRIEPPEVDLEVEVSTGTYVRSIGRDIGSDLGVGGHLTMLRRTRIGSRQVEHAVAVGDLGDSQRVASAMISMADAVSHLSSLRLEPHEAIEVRHGRSLRKPSPDAEAVALLSPSGELLAIAEAGGGVLRPRKVFA